MEGDSIFSDAERTEKRRYIRDVCSSIYRGEEINAIARRHKVSSQKIIQDYQTVMATAFASRDSKAIDRAMLDTGIPETIYMVFHLFGEGFRAGEIDTLSRLAVNAGDLLQRETTAFTEEELQTLTPYIRTIITAYMKGFEPNTIDASLDLLPGTVDIDLSKSFMAIGEMEDKKRAGELLGEVCVNSLFREPVREKATREIIDILRHKLDVAAVE